MHEVVVGRIGRPHGVRGEVSVQVRTDDPDRRLAPGAVLRTDPEAAGPLTVTSGRWHGGRLLLGVAGVEDRTAAERLRGVLLLVYVDAAERPDQPDEFYDRHLVGLRAETADGTVLGEVHEVLHLPGQVVLAVRRRGTGRESLVPFVAELVPEVDLAGGRIVVEALPGLLDDADDERPAPEH